MKRKKIFTFLTDTVFRRDASNYRTPFLRWLVKQYKLLFYTVRGLLDHGTVVRSAALTFYTLMSVVPILALVFAIVKGFGLAEGLIQNIYAAFPQNPEMIDYLVEFAQKALARTQGGVVALFGLATLFWAVIRVFGSVESAFNNIWEVKSTRSITRQWIDYITVVLVVPILWVIANALGNFAQQLLGLNDSILSKLLMKAAALGVIWIMFTFLYIVVPNTKVRFGSALTAGIVAGTAFLFFQWGYLYLQRWMTSYNAIYGSFAALPLFLVWLQTSWEIVLFGGELSFAYQNIDRFDEERESLLVSYDNRRKVILAVMLLAARAYLAGEGGVTASQARCRLNLPTRIVNDVLYQLVKAGLLMEGRGDDDREPTFIPARDVRDMTVYDVLDAIDRHGDTGLSFDDSPEMKHVSEVIERLKRSARIGDNVRLMDVEPIGRA